MNSFCVFLVLSLVFSTSIPTMVSAQPTGGLNQINPNDRAIWKIVTNAQHWVLTDLARNSSISYPAPFETAITQLVLVGGTRDFSQNPVLNLEFKVLTNPICTTNPADCEQFKKTNLANTRDNILYDCSVSVQATGLGSKEFNVTKPYNCRRLDVN